MTTNAGGSTAAAAITALNTRIQTFYQTGQ